MQKVSVIGLWYVWFPLLVAIAKANKFDVVGFDIQKEKIQQIKKWVCPIDDKLAREEMQEVTFTVSSEPDVLQDVDYHIICVPTPITKNYEPDLEPLISASKLVARYLKPGSYVVIESTVNPGMCTEVVLPLLEEESGLTGGQDFELGHCPERINPGDNKRNLYNINRNIGALTKPWAEELATFYREIISADVYVMETILEAESTKIIENTFRDINIAFVNELAQSFDKMGIDLVNVLKGAGNKPFAFLTHYPGCGVGGHCIAVDPYYLIRKASDHWFDHVFLKNARKINKYMPQYTVEKLVHALNQKQKSVKSTSVAVLWLSYKANVGDDRESPAYDIIAHLQSAYENQPLIYDPYFPEASTHTDLDKILKSTEAVIIATNHQEFLDIDYSQYPQLCAIVDGRNCLNSSRFTDSNIIYTGIGR